MNAKINQAPGCDNMLEDPQVQFLRDFKIEVENITKKCSVVLGLDANENRELNKNSYGDMVEGLFSFQ